MRYHCTSTGTVKMKQPSHAKPQLGHGTIRTLGNSHNHSGKQWGGLWWDWTYTSTHDSEIPLLRFMQEESMSTHTSMWSQGTDVTEVSIITVKSGKLPTVNGWTYGVCPNVQCYSAQSMHHWHTQPRGWTQTVHGGKSDQHQKAHDAWFHTQEILGRQNQTAVTEKRKGHLRGPRVA